MMTLTGIFQIIREPEPPFVAKQALPDSQGTRGFWATAGWKQAAHTVLITCSTPGMAIEVFELRLKFLPSVFWKFATMIPRPLMFRFGDEGARNLAFCVPAERIDQARRGLLAH